MSVKQESKHEQSVLSHDAPHHADEHVEATGTLQETLSAQHAPESHQHVTENLVQSESHQPIASGEAFINQAEIAPQHIAEEEQEQNAPEDTGMEIEQELHHPAEEHHAAAVQDNQAQNQTEEDTLHVEDQQHAEVAAPITEEPVNPPAEAQTHEQLVDYQEAGQEAKLDENNNVHEAQNHDHGHQNNNHHHTDKAVHEKPKHQRNVTTRPKVEKEKPPVEPKAPKAKKAGRSKSQKKPKASKKSESGEKIKKAKAAKEQNKEGEETKPARNARRVNILGNKHADDYKKDEAASENKHQLRKRSASTKKPARSASTEKPKGKRQDSRSKKETKTASDGTHPEGHKSESEPKKAKKAPRAKSSAPKEKKSASQPKGRKAVKAK